MDRGLVLEPGSNRRLQELHSCALPLSYPVRPEKLSLPSLEFFVFSRFRLGMPARLAGLEACRHKKPSPAGRSVQVLFREGKWILGSVPINIGCRLATDWLKCGAILQAQKSFPFPASGCRKRSILKFREACGNLRRIRPNTHWTVTNSGRVLMLRKRPRAPALVRLCAAQEFVEVPSPDPLQRILL